MTAWLQLWTGGSKLALLNAMEREGRGNSPMEVVLLLVLGESGTANRGSSRLMRWQRGGGAMSGH